MSQEDLFPNYQRFDDGSAIIAYSIADERYTVTHGDKKYSVKSIFVSNYAQAGGIIRTEPSYSIVVEHPFKSQISEKDLQAYIVEFVRTIKYGHFDKNKICHYIGRKDSNTNNMIISEKVKKEIVTNILEPELRKRKTDRDYAKRAELIAAMKRQNEK